MTKENDLAEQYHSPYEKIIKKDTEICPKTGKIQIPKCAKSKVTAGILAILLGGIGVHKFYLGHIRLGILYLIFFPTLFPSFFGLVEGIIYLTKSNEDFYAIYVVNKKAMF